MKRVGTLAALLVSSIALVGCGGGSSEQAVAQGDQAGKAAGQDQQTASPQQCVYDFLEAVRAGDDAKAGSMLTELAQEKTKQLDMEVAPPGSDTATFEVGKVETAGDGVARVASAWTDVEMDGSPRTDHMTWIVKQKGQKWRISGVSIVIEPDRGPIELNFENPEDIRRVAQQESQRDALDQADQVNAQAVRPSDPFQEDGTDAATPR